MVVALQAIVKDGRLVLDEPTDLPDGTVLELVADDETGELGPEELAQLNAALERGARALESGASVDGAALIARLRAKSP